MKDQVRLDIPLLLPDVRDEADRCVARLTTELRGREGVQDAHVVAARGDRPAQLCIHYDPDSLSLERVRDIARGAGTALTDKYQNIHWTVAGLTQTLKAITLPDRLRHFPGGYASEACPARAVLGAFCRSETTAPVTRKAVRDPTNRARIEKEM